MSEPYAPTLEAALARIAAVRPAAYARTRNALDGAVSGLSPYISHGIVSLAEVLAGVAAHHRLDMQHKFVYELGWRAYFRHVWQQHGDGILRSLHEGPLPDSAYATELPADIRQAQTGVPVIDEAVRTLYRSGMLHNHARMWLASYIVHLRHVHWRAGADWLYGHLLDGDLASNHLSWQWVAGTGSRKPYLFNAENVARYAPAAWHSPGSVIDTSYDALDLLARQPWPGVAASPAGAATDEPLLHDSPPAALAATAPSATDVAGRDVWLVHPWSLGLLPPALPADTLVLGLFVDEFHWAWPWSERRWHFVGRRMAELADRLWQGDAAAIGSALASARSVRSVAEPHLEAWLPRWAACEPAPALFPPVARRCDSFSQWWTHASRGLHSAADLLAVNEVPAW
ncbi:FAD-binding domain-containing protein [Roseateles sp.]|jgi:deoxyribodipyrimidine photo-lyase|uniref:FAD-binding domain-containing protein n=1 Tax=Roseateles sp. TaxID=1971397 RepID=UPI0037C86D84